MQLICVLLLVAAQQGALTHAVWHAGEGRGQPAPHRSDADGHGQAPAELCEFHAALNTVLGAAGASAPQLFIAAPDPQRPAVSPPARTAAEPVRAVSRGPPVLL